MERDYDFSSKVFLNDIQTPKKIGEKAANRALSKIGSTKPRLNVDIWSGNHPFYTGSQKILDTEGRVERFMRKYGIENTND